MIKGEGSKELAVDHGLNTVVSALFDGIVMPVVRKAPRHLP